jgi:hypothetical protein
MEPFVDFGLFELIALTGIGYLVRRITAHVRRIRARFSARRSL